MHMTNLLTLCFIVSDSLRAAGNGEFRLQLQERNACADLISPSLVVGSNNIKLCEILINYPMNFDVNYLARCPRSLTAFALSCSPRSRRVEQVKNTSWFLAFQSGPPRRGVERRTELDRHRRCTNP